MAGADGAAQAQPQRGVRLNPIARNFRRYWIMSNRLFEYTLALSVAQQRAELRLARQACDSSAEIERLELVLRWLEQPLQDG